MNAPFPISLCRSSLFSPTRPTGEKASEAQLEAANYKNWSVALNYSGPELTPSHAHAFQCIVALSYKKDAELSSAEVKVAEILRSMGRAVQTNSKRWVMNLIDDLTNAHVEVKSPLQQFSGRLLGGATAKSGSVLFDFHPDMHNFLFNEVVRVDLEMKSKICAHPLASWLLDYTSTLSDGFVVELSDLYRMSGSTLQPALFKVRVSAAFEALKELGAVTSYEITKGSVTIKKKKGRIVILKEGSDVLRKFKFVRAVKRSNEAMVKVPL